jgi:hypothetical protein
LFWVIAHSLCIGYSSPTLSSSLDALTRVPRHAAPSSNDPQRERERSRHGEGCGRRAAHPAYGMCVESYDQRRNAAIDTSDELESVRARVSSHPPSLPNSCSPAHHRFQARAGVHMRGCRCIHNGEGGKKTRLRSVTQRSGAGQLPRSARVRQGVSDSVSML